MSTLTGETQIYGIDPYAESETPIQNVGTKGVASDGRIYRYAKAASTAIATGKLCIAADITANHEDIAFAVAGAVGDTTVSIAVGATAIAANEYVNGYLNVTDDTGEGHIYLITEHGATAGSTTVVFTIQPGLSEATTTSTTVTLVRNTYREVVISDGTQADLPAGVTPIAVTASYYFWAQTGGFASVLNDTTTAVAGQPVTIGDADSGAVEVHNAATEVIVGICPAGAVGAAGEHIPVFLTMDA